MPKIAKVLKPLDVSRLTGNRAHPVGGVAGLMLKIDGVSRSWVLRITIGGHRRSMGLGPFPAVNLAKAREKAQLLREEVIQGNDPLRKKAAAKAALKLAQASAITFEQAARDYISHHESSWKNAKHASQWLSSIISKPLKLGRWFIDGGMLRGITDVRLQKRVITLYTDRVSFSRSLGIQFDEDGAYALVVNRDGCIAGYVSGAFTPDGATKIYGWMKLDALSSNP